MAGVGFGRFGAMLHALLSKGFEVDVFDKNPIDNSEINEVSLEDALKNETIFIAVPNRDFEELIINISDNREISVNQLAELTLQVVGKKTEIIYTKEREGQIYRSSIDNSLLREMGWVPKWNLLDGLKQCATWNGDVEDMELIH